MASIGMNLPQTRWESENKAVYLELMVECCELLKIWENEIDMLPVMGFKDKMLL